MAKSLQEQLLQAGLVDKNKVKQVSKAKKKQAKQQHRGQGANTNESEQWAREAKEAKLAKDRALSQKANEEAEKKAIANQIVQLIDAHKIDRNGGEIGYQFKDGNLIKKIFVTELMQNQLAKGIIAIARLNDGYELVPAAIASKIQERAEGSIVFQNLMEKSDNAVDEDDPYAGYEIPDDLMW